LKVNFKRLYQQNHREARIVMTRGIATRHILGDKQALDVCGERFGHLAAANVGDTSQRQAHVRLQRNNPNRSQSFNSHYVKWRNHNACHMQFAQQRLYMGRQGVRMVAVVTSLPQTKHMVCAKRAL
jgi:hypothetical protein